MKWDLTVDGVRLQDMAHASVRVLDGTQWSSMPGRRVTSVQIPGAHGVVPMLGGDTFEAAAFVIRMSVNGFRGASPGVDEWARYDDTLDQLLDLFGTTRRLLDVRRQMGDGTSRQAFCRVTDAFTPDRVGSYAQLNVALEIPAVFWQDVDAQTFTGTPGSTSPHAETVTTLTGSTAPVEDATITVDGPVTNPRVSQPDSGAWVTLDGTLAAGDQWVIDADKWTSTVNGASVITQTSYAGSGARLLTLSPVAYASGDGSDDDVPAGLPFTLGAPSDASREVRLTLTGTGMGATTNLSVTARRKFF